MEPSSIYTVEKNIHIGVRNTCSRSLREPVASIGIVQRRLSCQCLTFTPLCSIGGPLRAGRGKFCAQPPLSPIVGGHKYCLGCGGGGGFISPLGSKKLRYLATSGKRHNIDCDEISNFYKGNFWVSSILRLPEVTKGQI